MKNYEISFLQRTVNAVKEYGEAKKREGYVPTIDLFVEEMTEKINELQDSERQDEGEMTPEERQEKADEAREAQTNDF